jgi:hypothetical protein
MRAADYEQALEAVREWYAVHGRLPQAWEWEGAARGRPTTRTIRRRRWDWNQLMQPHGGACALRRRPHRRSGRHPLPGRAPLHHPLRLGDHDRRGGLVRGPVLAVRVTSRKVAGVRLDVLVGGTTTRRVGSRQDVDR